MRVRIKASPEWDGSVWLGKTGIVLQPDFVLSYRPYEDIGLFVVELDEPISRKQPTVLLSIRNLEVLDEDSY